MQSATEFLLKMRLVGRETSFPADIVKYGGEQNCKPVQIYLELIYYTFIKMHEFVGRHNYTLI